MADDIDDLLRRTMKTLDSQVPSGYFEDLPQRTLGRLEDSLMQTGSEEETDFGMSAAPLPDEDSGLHDIRSLARSTKQRISSRKIPQLSSASSSSSSSASSSDDDLIANSSSGWKAVALPEPAKMISLPDVADLPPPRKLAEASAVEIPDITPIDARVRSRNAAATGTSKRNRTIAGIGVAFAAAAGLVLFVATRKSGNSSGDLAQPPNPDRGAVQGGEGGAAPRAGTAPTGAGITATPPTAPVTKGGALESQIASDNAPIGGNDGRAPGTSNGSTGSGSNDPSATATTDAGNETKSNNKLEIEHVEKIDESNSKPAPTTKESSVYAKGKGMKPVTKSVSVSKPLGKKSKVDTGISLPDDSTGKTVPTSTDDKATKKVNEVKPGPKDGGGKTSKDSELDDLLKDASGVEKKPAKPVLDKKSLSADDFKSGMSAVSGKATACYKGTPGSVALSVSIGPDGKVKNVAVKGSFAGTPSGDCVASAVRSASFPPWDGPPQSFGYSFLLSE